MEEVLRGGRKKSLSHTVLSGSRRETKLRNGSKKHPALKDLQLFSRKLILKKLHTASYVPGSLNNTEKEAIRDLEDLLAEQDGPPISKFPPTSGPKSTRFPPLSLCPSVDIFTKLVSEDFKKLSSRRRLDNLTQKQRQAIFQLQSLEDVVFKPADKGGNIVVWPSCKYEKEVFRQLRDPETYQKLPSDPGIRFSYELRRILERAFESGVITKRVLDGLVVRFPRTPTFYLLPKVHKDALDPPGRPIVSGIGSICEPVCRFIEFYLKPLVEALPSYIRDTTDVLARVDGILVEPSTLLVTADVESLYTCTDHLVGVDAVRLFLGASDLDGPLCELVLELVDFILTHNFFVFKDQFYLQKRGTAMGVTCAPSYANLFLGAWERNLFGDGGPRDASHVLCWYRFIDDILFLWDGGVDQLGNFMRSLNVNNYNIRLTYKCDDRVVDFLDVRLEIDIDRRIQTDVFRKPTSVNSLLHASSAHDPATVRAIPVGQFLRMRRICSTNDRFEKQAQDMSDRFLKRGYSRRCIKRGYDRARCTLRSGLLQPTTRIGRQDRDDLYALYLHITMNGAICALFYKSTGPFWRQNQP
ncbi:uncharacterized protein [Dendrobates tinctorius]|uniref:uncharacterized protein n=1 Tax=Dendrobates tinctorius TaxID=92724 RepID=UPI003CCA1689